MGRELQQLRDAGLLEFRERGRYRWLGPIPALEPATPSNGIFLLPAKPDSGDRPERSYSLRSLWLRTARRLIDHWIIYQMTRPEDGGDYVSAASLPPHSL